MTTLMEIGDENLGLEIEKLKLDFLKKEEVFNVKETQLKKLIIQKDEEIKKNNVDYNSSIQEGIKWKEEINHLKEEIEKIKKIGKKYDEKERLKQKSELDKNVVFDETSQNVKLNIEEIIKVWREEMNLQGDYEEEEEKVCSFKEKISEIFNRIDNLNKEIINNLQKEIEKIQKIDKKYGDNYLLKQKSELDKNVVFDETPQNVKLNIEEIIKVWREEMNLQGDCEEEEEKVWSFKEKISKIFNKFDNLNKEKTMEENSLNELEDIEEDSSINKHQIKRAVMNLNGEVGENSNSFRDNIYKDECCKLKFEFTELKNKSLENCETCKNYEQQLQSIEESLKTQIKDYKALSEENQLNKQLILTFQESNNKTICQLNGATERHETIIFDLSNKYNHLIESYDRLRLAYRRFRENADKELKIIISERRDFKKNIEKVESAYHHLLGVRGKKSVEMEAEAIDLPLDIETAHFNLLTLKEEIIKLKSANEHLYEKVQTLELFSKTKERDDKTQKESILEEYNNDRKKLTIKSERLATELNKLKQAQKYSENFEETVRVLKIELETIKKNYNHLEKDNKLQRNKNQALQQELENSESVQQDFVRLSQTLQMQLEEIRQEEKELRWQFKDDILKCNDCQKSFQSNSNNIKYNCRHCGKVFCKPCLSVITLRQKGRKAEVCKVCHTMLIKDAPPYFSNNKIT